METIVTNPPLNNAQILLLQTFAHVKSKESFEELKSVLFDYYKRKLDEETDKWWEENNMTAEKFEDMCSNIHFRTPYITK
jgi:Txe/YoeB family toxin of Txe-Axe toxin-antitoxin module